MKMKFVTLAWLMIATSAHAESLVDGSAEAGQAKSITCAACHGPDGNSVNTLWPNLAGQHAGYAYEQLRAFKSIDDKPAMRQDPLMNSQVLMLSDEDMRNLAVYFENQTPAARAVSDASLVDRGEALYRGGDRISSASACMACHGPKGRGNPAAGYPSIAGQYADYTAKQLRDYASGTRATDGSTRVMRDIAARLSEDDIMAVSSYIQGLH